MAESRLLIAPLFDGAIDIVGDIHGEVDALTSLLGHLGYAGDGTHPHGRRLVFIGDLVDRGPDSPAVLRIVHGLVAAGRAQCVVGNHELNLLRNVERDGNSWWTRPERATQYPMQRIQADEKAALLEFLETLPLALEREDLRVVHACWHDASVAALRALNGPAYRVADLYEQYQRELYERMAANRFMNFVKKEWVAVAPRLDDRSWQPVFMPAKAELDVRNQMENPVAVLTSGMEAPAREPFWAGGKWRMVSRVKWWESYVDEPAVVMGHYWRRFGAASAVLADKHGPDLFAGIAPHHWMGRRNNVYCVDFSVGARAAQRARNGSLLIGRLAALRVPEWEVMHDDGEQVALGPPATRS